MPVGQYLRHREREQLHLEMVGSITIIVLLHLTVMTERKVGHIHRRRFLPLVHRLIGIPRVRLRTGMSIQSILMPSMIDRYLLVSDNRPLSIIHITNIQVIRNKITTNEIMKNTEQLLLLALEDMITTKKSGKQPIILEKGRSCLVHLLIIDMPLDPLTPDTSLITLNGRGILMNPMISILLNLTLYIQKRGHMQKRFPVDERQKAHGRSLKTDIINDILMNQEEIPTNNLHTLLGSTRRQRTIPEKTIPDDHPHP